MYIPDDKDIDRISREAAEHYHAPGSPDWNALQQTLDKELPEKKEKKRRGFFFFFLLLGLSVTGSLVWYGIAVNKKTEATVKTAEKNKIPLKQNTVTEENTVVAEKEKKTENSTVKPATEQVAVTRESEPHSNGSVTVPPVKDLIVLKNNEASLTPAATKPTSRVNTDNRTKNGIDFKTTESIAKTKKQSTDYKSVPNKKQKQDWPAHAGLNTISGKGNKHINHNPLIKNKIAVDADNGQGNDAANTNASDQEKNTDAGSKSNEQAIAQAAPDPINEKAIPAKDTLIGKASAVTEKRDTAKESAVKKKSKSKNDKAINIGLTAGFDVSTVKFTHGDNAGYNIGITGGYQFSKHWSVYTGIIYTKKNYELNGSDYNPPKHYWTQYVQLQTVEGYCRMWELPLLARYTFNTRAKTPFFVSTGLSSYFMKKQAYNYAYKTNAGVPANAAWSTDSSFNHVFSILHLSAGFEKRLGKHINWQIEPYAKIPLGGVGFGNIRLSSFGVNFSLQYRQPVKR